MVEAALPKKPQAKTFLRTTYQLSGTKKWIASSGDPSEFFVLFLF